jgi:hypothetical protein
MELTAKQRQGYVDLIRESVDLLSDKELKRVAQKVYDAEIATMQFAQKERETTR